MDEYYSCIFENSVPGLPEAAAAEGLTPLAYMRRYGAFELCAGVGPLHDARFRPANSPTRWRTGSAGCTRPLRRPPR